MNKYEIMFIVKPDLEETAIKKEAYNNGYYFLFVVEASHEAVKEFDRLAGINENILRHLIIRKED